MRIAFLGEDPSDEGILEVITGAISGIQITRHRHPFEIRGYSVLVRGLESFIRHLHYHSDAEALVVIVDSDRTFLSPGRIPNRHKELSDRISKLRKELTEVPGKSLLKVALGVPAPCIEAWLQCGADERLSEASWEASLDNPPPRYTSLGLKRSLYGDPPYVSSIKQQGQMRCAENICRAPNLDRLEQRFPIGFGSMAREIRKWPRSA